MTSRHALLFVSAVLMPSIARAQASRLPPQELHNRIVAVLARNARRPVPNGDTSVTWSPIPNLYTTVHRTPDTIASSLVRVDSMVGTAVASWRDGRQTHIEVRWTQRDSTLLDLDILALGDTLSLAGGIRLKLVLPDIPWAVADYGMEDQLLPLYENLSGPTKVAVYRPFPAKWDTLTVSTRKTEEALLISEIHPDGEEFRWLITLNGALVRLTRSKYPDFERRPLEQTVRMADYQRLKALVPTP